MKQIHVLMLAALCLVLMGTTYVVKEGDREVGRYDENDGKTETVEIENEIPKKTVPVPKAAKPATSPEIKPFGADNELIKRAQAQAEALSASTKKKNDQRHEEVKNAVKEMEENYK